MRAPWRRSCARSTRSTISSAEESMRVIDLLPSMYDEPFADWSQIPTYLVSTLARDAVTVALTGDGGDELFGGYDRYVGLDKIWRRLRLMPRPARQALAKRIDMVDRFDARRGSPGLAAATSREATSRRTAWS